MFGPILSRKLDALVYVGSAALVVVSAVGAMPFTVLESLGFATGAASVWLVVRASIWTWPLGIANNIVFIVLFLDARLYADMGLQFVYVALSIAGWWLWLHGRGGGQRQIGRASLPELVAVALAIALGTGLLTIYLRGIHDSAPFLDALTTAVSIAATYLMAKKLIESWWFWIAADLVYIPLYAWKGLPLTSLLYGIFLAMCVRGLFAWRQPFRDAVVAGKFYPFHAGHKHLITEARRQSQRVTVLVCAAVEQTISGGLRAEWIRATFPDVDVLVLDQTALGLSDEDSDGWARATIDAIGLRPDVVFSSEAYGDAYAAAMGAVHRLVDRDRLAVPISGTAIRRDPLRHLDFLEPHVRSHYVKRICLLGAESTGKTTLAQRLADRYGTVWVPEYGREFSERERKQLGDEWTTEEFRHIADVQAAREDAAACQAAGLLFCDTDVFTTARFHEAYTGRVDPELERRARARRYDLYLLCGLDAPFVQDGWRDDGPHRIAMDAAYRRHVAEIGAPWVELTGNVEQRLVQAATAIDDLLAGAVAA